MLMVTRACAVLVAAVMFGISTPAAAQLSRGTISGTVRDTTGGFLPGVAVSVTNNATGLVRAATSDGSGFYRVPGLDPGTYTVKFELRGFKVVENREVPVGTPGRRRLMARLSSARSPSRWTSRP